MLFAAGLPNTAQQGWVHYVGTYTVSPHTQLDCTLWILLVGGAGGKLINPLDCFCSCPSVLRTEKKITCENINERSNGPGDAPATTVGVSTVGTQRRPYFAMEDRNSAGRWHFVAVAVFRVANKVVFFVHIYIGWKSRLILHTSRFNSFIVLFSGLRMTTNKNFMWNRFKWMSCVVWKALWVFVLQGVQTKAFDYIRDGENMEMDNTSSP